VKDGAFTSMDKRDTDALRNAVRLLEHPSLAGRLSNMIGKPVELLGRALPAGASQAIATATTKGLAVASGAAGGAFGIISLPLELPVSTIIILRSILDIARSEGENLTDRESTLSCVEVLGIGGRAETDDAAKSDYFVVRGILAKSVKEASG
jgi:EcsC protein family